MFTKKDLRYSKQNYIPFYRGYLGKNLDLPEELLDSEGFLIENNQNSLQLIKAINQALEITANVTLYHHPTGPEAKQLVDYFSSILEEEESYGWLYLLRGLLNCFLHDVEGLEEDIKKIVFYEVDNLFVSYLLIKHALHCFNPDLGYNIYNYAHQLKHNAFYHPLLYQIEVELSVARDRKKNNNYLHYKVLNQQKFNITNNTDL